MKYLEQLLSCIKEFKQVFHELKRKYDSVSSVLIFPTIKKTIEELREFEKSRYLDLINGRNYQKLLSQVNHYIRDVKSHNRQMEIFLKSTRDYIADKYDSKLKASERSSSQLGNNVFSNYFSFDVCLNIYDIFINVKYTDNPSLVYQNVLNEKMKRKRLRIEELNAEIENAKVENGTRLFIEFLKKYDPYNKRLQIERTTKSTREIPRAVMKRDVAFTGMTHKEHILKMINQKTLQLKAISGRKVNKKDLLNYFELTGHVLELLKTEKREALQQICNDEFYIIKAKKFVSIMYENNKAENERLVKGLEELKQDNLKMRMNVEKFKRNFMASLNY